MKIIFILLLINQTATNVIQKQNQHPAKPESKKMEISFQDNQIFINSSNKIKKATLTSDPNEKSEHPKKPIIIFNNETKGSSDYNNITEYP